MRRIDLRWGATEPVKVTYVPVDHGFRARSPEIVRMVDRGMPRTWSFCGRFDLFSDDGGLDPGLVITPRVALAIGVGSSNWEMVYDARGAAPGPWFVDGTGQGSLVPAATISGAWIVDITGGGAIHNYVFTCQLGISPFTPYVTEEERAELSL